MNKLDKQYTDLLQDILDNGVEKQDRTGTGTISIFGRQIRHDMKDGFPLLTTKKMPFKTIVTELLWFLRGDTSIEYLLKNNCNIWTGDAYKNYCKYTSANSSEWNKWMRDNGDGTLSMFTQEQFVEKIKTDEEFAKQWASLGKIYGFQWRNWGGEYKLGSGEPKYDQIQNLINDLKTNPDSRRMVVNAWAVHDLPNMVLPPCHYGFQVYTRELSTEEKQELYFIKHPEKKTDDKFVNDLVFKEIEKGPQRAISLMWNQRSVDTFLGLPFNIASYGLLLEIIAKEVNMVPDELIGNLGDVHLYSNHVEQAKEQIGRELTLLERTSLGNFRLGQTVTELHCDSQRIARRTREPFPLPSITITERNWYQHQLVKEHLGEKTLDEKLKSYRPDCFELIGYQSHPKIKAPLSN